MPRVAKELSAIEVKRLQNVSKNHNVNFAVGGVAGLQLQITPSGGRSWLLRAIVGGKRRHLGLGAYPEISLAVARERARQAKERIRSGVDPGVERQTARAELIAEGKRNLRFKDAVDKCLAGKLKGFKNEKHRQQWANTLQSYAVPVIGEMFVQDITVHNVMDVIEPIWLTKTETASRLRARIEAVLSWATVNRNRSGENPARWAGNLKELLPAPDKVAKEEHHPAVQIDDAHRWFEALSKLEGVGSRALEFTALTASRSFMVRGATWDEFNLIKGMWTIPAVRMKMDREHRVPLPSRALSILKSLPKLTDNPLVFPAPREGMLSDMTLSGTMGRLHEADIKKGGPGFIDAVSKRPAVPHGLRSTFRDWVADRTNFPGEMAEIALSHQQKSAVEAAYKRGHMVEKRREMMDAWAKFLLDGK